MRGYLTANLNVPNVSNNRDKYKLNKDYECLYSIDPNKNLFSKDYIYF